MPRSTTRWRPSSEQLMILQDLYRRGVTNPNAAQIQNITAHLAVYGNIQGKNVFYWFQNHKARDRQKLRKKLRQLHEAHRLDHLPLLPKCYSKVSEVWERATRVMMSPQTWMADLPRDWLIRKYGDDLVKIEQVGGISPWCRNRRPPETLELFPLTADHWKGTAS